MQNNEPKEQPTHLISIFLWLEMASGILHAPFCIYDAPNAAEHVYVVRGVQIGEDDIKRMIMQDDRVDPVALRNVLLVALGLGVMRPEERSRVAAQLIDAFLESERASWSTVEDSVMLQTLFWRELVHICVLTRPLAVNTVWAWLILLRAHKGTCGSPFQARFMAAARAMCELSVHSCQEMVVGLLRRDTSRAKQRSQVLRELKAMAARQHRAAPGSVVNVLMKDHLLVEQDLAKLTGEIKRHAGIFAHAVPGMVEMLEDMTRMIFGTGLALLLNKHDKRELCSHYAQELAVLLGSHDKITGVSSTGLSTSVNEQHTAILKMHEGIQRQIAANAELGADGVSTDRFRALRQVITLCYNECTTIRSERNDFHRSFASLFWFVFLEYAKHMPASYCLPLILMELDARGLMRSTFRGIAAAGCIDQLFAGLYVDSDADIQSTPPAATVLLRSMASACGSQWAELFVPPPATTGLSHEVLDRYVTTCRSLLGTRQSVETIVSVRKSQTVRVSDKPLTIPRDPMEVMSSLPFYGLDLMTAMVQGDVQLEIQEAVEQWSATKRFAMRAAAFSIVTALCAKIDIDNERETVMLALRSCTLDEMVAAFHRAKSGRARLEKEVVRVGYMGNLLNEASRSRLATPTAAPVLEAEEEGAKKTMFPFYKNRVRLVIRSARPFSEQGAGIRGKSIMERFHQDMHVPPWKALQESIEQRERERRELAKIEDARALAEASAKAKPTKGGAARKRDASTPAAATAERPMLMMDQAVPEEGEHGVDEEEDDRYEAVPMTFTVVADESAEQAANGAGAAGAGGGSSGQQQQQLYSLPSFYRRTSKPGVEFVAQQLPDMHVYLPGSMTLPQQFMRNRVMHHYVYEHLFTRILPQPLRFVPDEHLAPVILDPLYMFPELAGTAYMYYVDRPARGREHDVDYFYGVPTIGILVNEEVFNRMWQLCGIIFINPLHNKLRQMPDIVGYMRKQLRYPDSVSKTKTARCRKSRHVAPLLPANFLSLIFDNFVDFARDIGTKEIGDFVRESNRLSLQAESINRYHGAMGDAVEMYIVHCALIGLAYLRCTDEEEGLPDPETVPFMCCHIVFVDEVYMLGRFSFPIVLPFVHKTYSPDHVPSPNLVSLDAVSPLARWWHRHVHYHLANTPNPSDAQRMVGLLRKMFFEYHRTLPWVMPDDLESGGSSA